MLFLWTSISKKESEVTENTPELVGGKYSREVMDKVCNAKKRPLLNDKQWKLLIEWCEDLEPDDVSDEVDYFMANLASIEADTDDYEEVYLRVHGKTYEESRRKGNENE
jgi:hypothetical protein